MQFDIFPPKKMKVRFVSIKKEDVTETDRTT
jgi:hypothetical protein